MKVTIEIDCTPEEARRALGWPDLSPLHERYLARLAEALDANPAAPDVAAEILRGFAPAGEAGLELWRKLLAGGARPGG